MNRAQSLLALFVPTLLLVGLVACEPLGAAPAPIVASPSPANSPQPDVLLTATVLASTPGSLIDIEGVLEVEGSLPQLRFFLLSADGTRIEILPWLPVEVVQPPDGQTAPETMAAWAGQKVKLRGSWVQSGSGLAFQVTSAERG